MRIKLKFLVILLGSCLVCASANPARYESNIKAFEISDKTNPPPKEAILFIGSSSIVGWKTLAQDFPDLKVINRGFGGSTISECTAFVERIVIPYHPRMIVFYAGDNDLPAGKTPRQVLTDYKAFVRKVREALPKVRIAFISIKPSPSRWKFVEKQREANKLIAEFSRRTEGLDYIDVFTAMLGPDGKPKPDLFRPDNLHMTEKGYKLWADIVRPHLRF